MKYVAQKNHYDCGPACISMVSGIPEDKVLKLLGKKFHKGITHRVMSWALRQLDIPHSKWLKDGGWCFSDKAILEYSFFSLRDKYIKGHYIIKYKNKYYDPAYGVRKEFLEPLVHRNDYVKVDCYIDIYN